jgi:diaminopimelate decarboxylase
MAFEPQQSGYPAPPSGPPHALALAHAPMRQFRVAHGELLVGELPLCQLAARAGQTPFYAYDRALLRERVAELRQALPRSIRLHYALKANPMPALVGLMASLVDGIDVASGGELKCALDAGAQAQNVSFAGPGKRDGELRQAVAAGVLVHLESEREVEILERHCNDLGMGARVAVRVNPDFELKGSGMKMGGGSKPFGVDVERVPQMLQHIRQAGLAFEGFHLFAGSQNLHAQAICEAQQQSYALALRLPKARTGWPTPTSAKAWRTGR